jgi:hypothetical protein
MCMRKRLASSTMDGLVVYLDERPLTARGSIFAILLLKQILMRLKSGITMHHQYLVAIQWSGMHRTSSSCRISVVGSVLGIITCQGGTHSELCHLSDPEPRSMSDDSHQTWRYGRGIREDKQKKQKRAW